MNKRAEIWMVFPPDQEYRYGEYPFNTTEECYSYEHADSGGSNW